MKNSRPGDLRCWMVFFSSEAGERRYLQNMKRSWKTLSSLLRRERKGASHLQEETRLARITKLNGDWASPRAEGQMTPKIM